MDKTDRMKVLVRYIINNGMAENQSDLGIKMGYNNASAFSQVINGKVKTPKDFTDKFVTIVPDLNVQWLLTGEGEMLRPSISQTAGDGSVNVANVNGNGNGRIGADPDALLSAHVKLIDELVEQRKVFTAQFTAAQSQIDRLLSLLERAENN